MEKVRLQKYFTECGVLSRRAAEQEIAAGRVTVNGEPAELGMKITPGSDTVLWKGRTVGRQNDKAPKKTVIAVHKPRGYVCTMKDEKGRRQVSELVSDLGYRVYPVGRLDMASEGLLLMTDDGELANLLTHPSHHVDKTYQVRVRGDVNDDIIARLGEPFMLDGRATSPAEVRQLVSHDDGAKLEIIIHEGRNRQIRRMCEECGLEVVRLKRVAIANIGIRNIAPGRYRILDRAEVEELRRIALGNEE